MNYFIKNIHINKLFHLENIDIPIANEKYPHLIITGKNGSGKTVLLNAIATFFDNIKEDTSLSFLKADSYVGLWEKQLRERVAESDKAHARMMLKQSQERVEWLFGKVNVQFCDVGDVIEKYNRHGFIIAFYQADRKVKLSEPNSPTKPKFQYRNVRDTSTFQFLNFMSDLKIQEALARNEKQFDDADEINAWFVDFEKLLQQIFQDEALKLEFNYKDYSFWICCTEGKRFKFTQLSDGFAAALDIVADLIMKMQDDNSLTRDYQKEGIVLIDEIETHLHLGLQKIIMPLLTRIFPNIQFIVTTHSPFVLNSMPDAVAYDLEHKGPIDDLTNYSYESLAEGYFGVSTESSTVEMRLRRLQELLSNKVLTDSDKNEIRQLMVELDKISEAVSPDLVGEYLQIKINNVDKIKEIGK